MRYTPLPKRSDVGINFDAYQNLHYQARKFMGTTFDPNYFWTMEDPTGVYVSLNSNVSGSTVGDFDHHYKTVISSNVNSTSYTINTGYWRRNGDVATYNGEEVDPGDGDVGINIIPDDYTGPVYNYIVRKKSFGGTDALNIVLSAYPLPNSLNSFKMEELVSVVTFSNGAPTTVSQNLVGSIDDMIQWGGGPDYTELDNFGLVINKPDKFTTAIEVNKGEIRRRDVYKTVDSLPLNVIDRNKKIWVDLIDREGTPQYDPSLIPTLCTIQIGDNFPDYKSYSDDFFKLYELSWEKISLDAPGGGSGLFYESVRCKRFSEGAQYTDWVRPDGVDCGNADIDDKKHKGRTIGFINEENPHKGEAEDFDFHRQVLDKGLGITKKDGDQIMAWYGYMEGEKITSKTYLRVDAVNAADWQNCGKSLSIRENILELWRFFNADATPCTDFTTQSPVPFLLLARDSSGAVPELKYLDVSNLRVANAASSSYADFANTTNTVITISGSHPHENHTFNSDNHTTGGIDRYVMVDGDEDRNNMSGYIGTGGGLKSIFPTDGYLFDVAEQISVDWQDRYLTDSSELISLNWCSLELWLYSSGEGADLILSWAEQKLYGLDTAISTESVLMLDWRYGYLYNRDGVKVAKWNDSKLTHDDDNRICWNNTAPDQWYIAFDANKWNPNAFEVDADISIQLAAPTISANSTGAITIDAGTNLTVNAGNSAEITAVTITSNSSGATTLDVGSDLNINIGGNMVVNSNTFGSVLSNINLVRDDGNLVAVVIDSGFIRLA